MSEIIYPAHIVIQKNGDTTIQTVAEHLYNTASIAAKWGKEFGLEKSAYLIGIVHDAGKYSMAFKNYIEKAARKEYVVRGSVNHTFAGVRLILSLHGKSATCTMDDVALELLAYAVGAHHGLFDCVTDAGANEFERRIHENHPECDESIQRYYQEVMNREALTTLICEATDEIVVLLKQCSVLCGKLQQIKFFVGLLARLLLSFLIDADRQDTASFMSNEQFPKTFNIKDWQKVKCHADTLYEDMVGHSAPTPVNQARQLIASACVERIGRMGNVIRLNIPTGAGKTITSLRAALNLVNLQKKKRIIYTAPLLSILEQNANEIRRYIGNDTAVLEHHSNIISTTDEKDELCIHDLLAQNWSAPVIVTTMVQLLNTMFDGATGSVRRFHALGDSVIIIDEVQTVPKKMLTIFNLTLSFLSLICRTTFILCSATQPNLEKAERPPLMPIVDLMPYQASIWQPFKRTKLTSAGSMRLSEVPVFIEKTMDEYRSLLVVCNKKAEAAYLIKSIAISEVSVVHLSASMCTSHRRETLKRIQRLLENHEKVLCISTQVIEAGVDISFDCVIRFTAGMDSIVQAAGRCNRHGENEKLSPVFILHCADEPLTHLPDIEAGKSVTLELLNDFQRNPARYGNRLESDEAVQSYYARLYQNMSIGMQDYPIKKSDVTLFQLLSDNQMHSKQDRCRQHYFMAQAFKTAGAAFEVFDTEGIAVIVPWRDGQKIIDELQTVYIDDLSSIRQLIQRARPYTVTVYEHQYKQLCSAGGIIELLDGAAYALSSQYYDEMLGLSMPDNQFLEV